MPLTVEILEFSVANALPLSKIALLAGVSRQAARNSLLHHELHPSWKKARLESKPAIHPKEKRCVVCFGNIVGKRYRYCCQEHRDAAVKIKSAKAVRQRYQTDSEFRKRIAANNRRYYVKKQQEKVV